MEQHVHGVEDVCDTEELQGLKNFKIQFLP